MLFRSLHYLAHLRCRAGLDKQEKAKPKSAWLCPACGKDMFVCQCEAPTSPVGRGERAQHIFVDGSLGACFDKEDAP